jgi:hypothetical protein
VGSVVGKVVGPVVGPVVGIVVVVRSVVVVGAVVGNVVGTVVGTVDLAVDVTFVVFSGVTYFVVVNTAVGVETCVTVDTWGHVGHSSSEIHVCFSGLNTYPCLQMGKHPSRQGRAQS